MMENDLKSHLTTLFAEALQNVLLIFKLYNSYKIPVKDINLNVNLLYDFYTVI